MKGGEVEHSGLWLFHPRVLRNIWCIVGISFLATLLFQGSRGLYDSTEGRYAECARQTMESGDFDDPILNGHYHWAKPPLTYMAIMAGLKLFGENAWGVRLFLVPCFIGTIVCVYYIGCLLWNRSVAFWAALIYATSPFTMASSNMVSTDVLLTLWESLAMVLYWLALRHRKSLYMVLMWSALGLGFLTKGPPSLLVLGGIFVTQWALKRSGKDTPVLFHPLGLALFAAIGLGWFAVEALHHEGLLRYWLGEEVVRRNISGEFHRNHEFYWVFVIYLPALLFGTGVWVLFVLCKARALKLVPAIQRFRYEWKNSPEWIFLLSGTIIPLALLSISKSRLPLYVLPMFVPISLALGVAMDRIVAGNLIRTTTLVLAACCMWGLFVTGKLSLSKMEPQPDMKRLQERLSPVLDQHPEAQLFVVARKPLYGLQFYLKRSIPVVSPENSKAFVTKPLQGFGDIALLMPAKKASKILPSLQDRTSRSIELNRHWVLAFFPPPSSS